MSPVVDRLEAQYGNETTFRRLNAQDGGEGQRAFHESGLPGHPGYLLLAADGTELWRGFGQLPQETLEAAIREALLEGE